MKTPTHLSHKPIISVENYEIIDGKYSEDTDAKVLSIGIAQWDKSETDITAKVFRNWGDRWSRQSEELPLHRVFDLSILAISSFMRSKENMKPTTYLKEQVVNLENLQKIENYFVENKTELTTRIDELKRVIELFNSQK